MPRLNNNGSLWCSGIAGAGFYGGDFVADQPHVIVELHPAGMRAFLTDDEAVTQVSDAQVDAVNCRTGARRIVDPMGAGEIFSGGGEWASFLADRGVRTSTGLVLPSAYVGAGTGPMRNDCVGPDGEMAIKEQYHSAGPWHLYARNGSRHVLSSGDAANIQLLGNGRYIYRVGWTWFGVGVPVPSPLTAPAWNLRYLDTPEGWWTIYQENNGRVFAHLNGSPVGYILGSATDAFGIDAVLLPDGRIRVIWTTSEGEAPSSIVTVYFRLTDSRVPLVGPVPVPTPVPSPTPLPPTEPHMTYPIPDRVKVIVQTLYERNLVLAKGTDDQRRELIMKIAQQVAFELGPLWGTKRADPGRPPSKDALAYYADGVTLYSADCFNGDTRKPDVPNVMEALPGQVFIAVTATNHLGGVTPPVPAPVPVLTPPASTNPTPTQWIEVEFPQLVEQFKRSGLGEPDVVMAAFMTMRRYGLFPGEVWSFERLMADLVAQGVANGSIPR